MEGIGRLTLPPYCKINLRNSILFSNNKANRDVDSDIIPENSKTKLSHIFSEIVREITP